MTMKASSNIRTGRPQPPSQSPRRSALTTGVGLCVEYYDWAVYAIFAPFFATQIFNPNDPTSAILATLAIFAVGFVARPFGGLIFGWVSDRIGRKPSMTIAVGLAALGSLAISLTPTYAAVGVLAPILLLVARLLQGLAHGGELPSAQTYLAEVAPRERRGLWSSIIYIAATVGVIFGTLLGSLLTGLLTVDQMATFGWRIPFFIGAVFGLYGLFMRARMSETEAFEGIRNKHVDAVAKPSLWTSIVEHRKQAFQVVGMTVGATIIFYVWSVNAPAHAITSLNIASGPALLAATLANIVFIAALPLWGRLSDRIGRKPVMLIGLLGAAALHFPMTWFIRDAAWQLGVSMSVMLIFVAAITSITPAVYAEMFPPHIRTVGVAVPYALCVAVFGGTAPYLQTLFSEAVGQPWMFNLYAVALLFTSAAVVRSLPETKGKDMNQ
ncbi:MFS transporter [Glutamicibacter sp. NPDC087583]|uniref:MFS transporter n=1 Tax=unclassified Glutamicibacter TaxID=2627139 RepID=UPI000FABE95B